MSGFHAANNTPHALAIQRYNLNIVFAVEWLQSGRSIYDLQQRLGHASIKTTEIYLQFLTPEEKRKAMGQ